MDEGYEGWIYTAHFFPKTQAPADVVDPWTNNMADKATNENLFTKWSHCWVCGYQSHKTKMKFRLIRFLLNGAHVEEGGFHKVD